MQRIQALLQGTASNYLLRDPRPGDMGLVAEIVAKLYQKAGFELVEEEPTLSFGQQLASQTWARAL